MFKKYIKPLSYLALILYVPYLLITKQAKIDPINFIYKKIFNNGLIVKNIGSPKLRYEFTAMPVNYKSGLKVHGVVWRNDFRLYYFKVDRPNELVEISDYKLSLELPSNMGIVNWNIKSRSGVQEVSVDGKGLTEGGIVRNKQIDQIVTTYTNRVDISSLRITTQMLLEIMFVVKVTKPSQSGGLLSEEFFFIDGKGDRKSLKREYLINQEEQRLIVGLDPATDAPKQRTMVFIPSEPIVFKNSGKIEYAESDVNR